MQVDFLLGGARKAGTTSLTHYLNAHPDIYMPFSEIHFFTRRYQKGIDWYHQQFKQKDGFIGENSNSYISERCADRILDYNKEMKVIFIIRNPIKRAYSDYWHEHREGRVKKSFETCVDLYLKNQGNKAFYNVLNRSKYKDMITYYQMKFPPNQLLFIKSEDLRNNREKTYAHALKFLERGEIIPDEVKKIYNIGQDVRSKAIADMYQKQRDVVIGNGGVRKNPFAYTIRFISMLNRPGTLTRKLFRKSDKLQKAHFYPDMKESTKEKLEDYFQEDIKIWSEL